MKGYLEIPDEQTLAAFDSINTSILRKNFFNAIIDQGYRGPELEDISLVPRVFPASYKKVIEDACYQLTRTILAFANKDSTFILKHLLPDDRWRTLIERHGILDKKPERMIGELRYDFAISGPLTEKYPPQLMEINGAALGLYAFASFLPSTVKSVVPGLDHLEYTDVTKSFVSLCKRVGPEIASFFPGQLYWGDDLLVDAMNGESTFHLVTPVDVPNQDYWSKLKRAVWRVDEDDGISLFYNNKWHRMDGFRWARVLTRGDIREFGALLGAAVRGPTVYMSPPRVEYVSNKGVLPLLCKEQFLKNELQIDDPKNVIKYISPTRSLEDFGFPKSSEWDSLVLKHNFGSGGNNVFVGNAIADAQGQCDDPTEWILQDRLHLNQMYTRLLYTNDRPLKMDLGVFVNYDFNNGKLEHFEVAGIAARGSHRNIVNMTQGGAGIPVLWSVN